MHILRNYKYALKNSCFFFLNSSGSAFIFLLSNELVDRKTFIWVCRKLQKVNKQTKKLQQECPLISTALVQLERPFLGPLEKLDIM